MSTVTLGFGACPLGACAFGYGSPATNTAPPPLPFVQADGSTGDCAAIDPASGDFILDASGNKVGWDSVSQRVYFALKTLLGSAAVVTMGIVWPAGVVTPDLTSRNRLAVAAALKPLIDANLVSLVDVTTTPSGPSGERLKVRWRRVSTGQIEATFV